ncbi:pto-interacting protein 1-like isoform X3 [Bidens hawaiensis]|uniref:pto-interacting protein 1-like isoform X3 n=1 Tax=Bidens hawaiensis TaxID=980011 RepID=UPI004049CBC5
MGMGHHLPSTCNRKNSVIYGFINRLFSEGSYGTVYHGVLLSGKAAAINELHFGKQPVQEFYLIRHYISVSKEFKHIFTGLMVFWAKSDDVFGLIGCCVYGGLRMRAYMVQMDTYTVARYNDIEHGKGLHVIGGSHNSKDAEG